MVERILEFFASLPAELYVFVISALPIVELRGAIPIGAALGLPFYTNYALAVLGNILPVPLILPFIPKTLDFLSRFKLFQPMVKWLREKANKNSKKVLGEEPRLCELADGELSTPKNAPEEMRTAADASKAATVPYEARSGDEKEKRFSTPSNSTRPMTKAVFIALSLFVALPVPGTGAWTGALVASLFNLPRKTSFLAVLLGVLLCGVIMSLASYGVLGFLSFLL